MSTLPDARRKRKSLGAPITAGRPMEKDNLRRKGSRSKSIGPGGLDALQKTSGNRRASLATSLSSFQPRGILKLAAGPSASDGSATENLIDLDFGQNMTVTGAESFANALSDTNPGSKIALRTEEEQQAAAKEREERERKDARRKSLGANRRVSFAAEATLYTFHEIEDAQDSTASTGSSRRASSATQQPPAGNEGEDSNGSRNQQSSRRSSSQYTADLDNRDDNTLASSAYSSDSDAADAVEEVEDHEDDGDSSDCDDSDDGDGTMVTIDGDEVTSASVGFDADDSSIDEALRLAAQHAGTQRLGSDDGFDEEEEIIPSFGWIKKGPVQAAPPREPPAPQPPSHDAEAEHTMDMDMEMEMEMDMDITSAVGGVIQRSQQAEPDDTGEMSMDVTRAFGTIMGQNQRNATAARDASPATSDDSYSMEFTTAIGGIRRPACNDETIYNDEDMSMELTTAMGGVLGLKGLAAQSRRRTMTRADQTMNVDETMDFTLSAGRILSTRPTTVQNDSTSEDDATMDMDMTMATGKILPSVASAMATNPADDEVTEGLDMATIGNILKPQPESRLAAKSTMIDEANKPDSPSKSRSTSRSTSRSPKRRQAPVDTSSTPSEPNSTSHSAFRGTSLLRRSLPSAPVETPTSTPQAPTKPASPPKQRGSTPSRTPSPTKTSSPRRTLRPRSPQRKTPERTPSNRVVSKSNNSLFMDDPKTGSRTPTVVLTPQRRQLSGLGLDREGLGSPRVSALLDRRTSIGDSSETFSPGQASARRRVAFEDPRVIEQEVDQERKDEEEEEKRRRMLEKGTNGGQDDNELTLNLKEMIAQLSPKKKPLRGRKSLHVGSAMGVLGKRPTELDDSDEERDGVKRLKNHQSSPVKSVRLQQPPSKAETTTGRLTRSRKSTEHDKENVTPPLNGGSDNPATTPKAQDRFRHVGDDNISQTVEFDEPTPRRMEAQGGDDAEGRIHLQDFLSMISVRFMELTTSKRRQTQMPIALPDGQDDMSLERCVVAGACTVPMLELYQHSCRELKKYISEGRRIVKEIESETFEENPPLFREYTTATPDFKMLMDNQFKNVKTHARLLSKAMWYEWRSKLQDGLKEGLVGIAEGMEEDDKALSRQQELLDSVLPGVLARHEALTTEHANLETYAKELAECDPEELQAARDELVGLESDIEAKKKAIAELRSQLQETTSEIEQASAKKQECLEEIKEAEKIREECKGWSTSEINLHKARVEALEKEHGWAVTGVSGTQISLSYKRAIEIVFNVTSFKPNQPNSQIDVWYIAADHDGTSRPATAERQFFLQLIRDYVRALPQSRTKISHMLHMVRAGWDMAAKVAKEIRLVNVTFPTKVTKTSDSSIAVVSGLMVVSLATRVEVTLRIRGAVGPGGVEIAVEPEARVCYGESYNVGKIAEFLAERVGGSGERAESGRSWSDALVLLHEKLLARGKKLGDGSDGLDLHKGMMT